MKTSTREGWSIFFYWVGIACAFLTIVLVFIGHSKWGSGLERAGFPLAWKLAGISVIAFLVREVCRPCGLEQTKRASSRSIDHIPHEI